MLKFIDFDCPLVFVLYFNKQVNLSGKILSFYMLRIAVFAIFISLAFSYYYFPLYKQCDSRWGSQALGTGGGRTICQAGCLISSAAMALSGIGQNYNPETLNNWLINNGGYWNGNLFIWRSIDSLGLSFDGFISNSAIKSSLDSNKIVIINVRNGGHYVLATGYSGDTIFVEDPGYWTHSYHLSSIISGNTGVYSATRMRTVASSWVESIQ